MIRLPLLLVACLLAWTTPAAAWDPYWDDWWREEPVVWYEPEPVDDIWWWHAPAWEPAPPPPAVPVVPPGIYYVTEVYVADVVSVAGPVTTYGTATISDTPGTYARVADTVGTGASSALDGTSFNGRASLGDGRPVAGTYYENFVLTGGTFVPVSVVFFQDDSVVAAPPAPTPAPVPTPAPYVPAPAPTAAPPPIAWIAPVSEPVPATPAPRRAPVLRPGVASSPLGDIAFSLEVLRGRAAALWFRAAADGVTVPVESWRVVAGEHTALGATSGGREDPFRARWDVVTRPGGVWTIGIEATVLVDGITFATTGEVSVVVRSPALIR